MRKSQITIIAFTLSEVTATVIAILVNEVSNALVHLPLWFAGLLLIFMVGIEVGVSVWWYRRQNSISAKRKRKKRDRKRMLDKVKSVVTDYLKESLHDVLITPRLTKQTNLLVNSWRDGAQESSGLWHPLPPDTRISEAYSNFVGELLILGEPGSGKTTLLFELAHDLVERASLDNDVPVPAIFNLSSWAIKRQPLDNWLVEELHSKYGVESEIGQPWIVSDEILPLLDGLDEVDSTYRGACVDAINTYLHDHGLIPLVVCSRSAEFEALGQNHPLQLRHAIRIDPLTPEQVDDYLARAGEKSVRSMRTLRDALHRDTELQKLAANPLLLSLIVQVYREQQVKDFLRSPLEARRQRIFETYVQKRLEHPEEKRRYTPQQTVRWLAWLAQQMKRGNQTEFYIERLQPSWLPTDWSRQVYRGITTVILAEFFLGASGFLAGSFPGLCFGLLIGVLIGPLNILLNIVLRSSWPWLRLLAKSLCFGLFGGLNFASLTILFIGQFYGQDIASTNGAIFGTVVGVFGLFLDKLAGEPDMKVEPAEVVVWSWPEMGVILAKFLFLGLAGGLIFALFFGASDSRANRLLIGLLIGLILGLFFGLIGGWEQGVKEEKKRVTPNQGVWHSARNGVRTGLLSGSVIGLLVGLLLGVGAMIVISLNHGKFIGLTLVPDTRIPVWLEFGALFGMIVALLSGVFTGVVAALFGGGSAWIKHFILRFLLWLGGFIPWRYSRFLDYAAKRRLLFKVGGGYQFVHRLLRDYFTTFNVAATPTQSPVASSVQGPYNVLPTPASVGHGASLLQPGDISGIPSSKYLSGANTISKVITLVLILVFIGISAIAFLKLKHDSDTTLATAKTPFTVCHGAGVPSTNVTPMPSKGLHISPSGLPVDPTAAAIVTHLLTTSAVDSNNCPTNLTNTFRVNQIVYVTFDLRLQEKTGYVEVKWYFNNHFGKKDIVAINSLDDTIGYFGVSYSTSVKGEAELYWCTKSDCRDAKLAGFVDFTITSTSLHQRRQLALTTNGLYQESEAQWNRNVWSEPFCN